MDQQLSLVERTEVAGRGVAKADNAQQLSFRRVDDGDGVGELVGRIEPILARDGDVGRGRGEGRLPGMGGEGRSEQQQGREAKGHVSGPCA